MKYILRTPHIQKKLAFFVVAFFALSVVPLSAAALTLPFDESSSFFTEEPMIAGKAVTAWISLLATLIIFVLVGKYMKGGRLAKPILLIGFGALAESFIGLVVPQELHKELIWIGDLLFSVAVIIAIFWMERIFRSALPE